MSDLFSVKDKVVMITGGNRNIGKALAQGFAEDGAKVVIGNTSKEKAADIIKFMEDGNYDYLWLPMDVGNKESIVSGFQAVMEKYGKLDVLVNNAGMRVNQTGLEHGDEEWGQIFDVNVKGTMICSQEACKIMKEQGGGKIVNTSSISAVRGMKMRTSYCATKGAINAYTAATAVEWAEYNVFVNAVGWGGVDVEETPAENMSAGLKSTLKMTPLGKLANKDMLYGAVRFLATDASNGMTGQTMLVDGGWSIIGKPIEN